MSSNDTIIAGLSKEQLKLYELFHPVAFKQMMRVADKGTRFVHYASADTAMRIIRSNHVWMRKASCMNDFMEMEHGLECLQAARDRYQVEFLSVFDGMFPGICAKFDHLFEGWLPQFRFQTYLACISEHGDESTEDEEDEIDRLSMWRAYGGNTGVAIVMQSGPFLRPTEALKAYTSPVAYLSRESFGNEFKQWLDGIASNSEWLKSLGEEIVFSRLFNAFRYVIFCTKHPGFREEREWRIIYSPAFEKSERLIPDIQSIGGTPQPIYMIPLLNIPEEGLTGITIPELIDRVIIGPTQFPVAIMEALIGLLQKAGMKDATNKVVISHIPVRQFD